MNHFIGNFLRVCIAYAYQYHKTRLDLPYKGLGDKNLCLIDSLYHKFHVYSTLLLL